MTTTVSRSQTRTAEIVRRDVDIPGLRMHIAEAGTGPLVLLLHGFPETSAAWAGLMAPLAAAGLRVVAPDQRGVGLSSKPPGAAAIRCMHWSGRLSVLLTGADLGQGTFKWTICCSTPQSSPRDLLAGVIPPSGAR